jgi:hypothetical protein
MSFIKELRKWRSDRNITTPNTKVYIANIIEELLEIYFKNKRLIKFLQFLIMIIFSIKKPISKLNTLDAILDISVFSTNEAELMGYDMDKAMNEVVKEISSRVQDPIQKEEWSKSGAVGKWQKDLSQNEDTLYKADFDKAKI